MSASLVGSEMCIRDSAHSFVHAHAHVHGHTHSQAHSQSQSQSQSQSAVSYTHLTLPTICSV
eukprot:12150492-Alexandrium_andersonii.AAC.1